MVVRLLNPLLGENGAHASLVGDVNQADPVKPVLPHVHLQRSLVGNIVLFRIKEHLPAAVHKASDAFFHCRVRASGGGISRVRQVSDQLLVVLGEDLGVGERIRVQWLGFRIFPCGRQHKRAVGIHVPAPDCADLAPGQAAAHIGVFIGGQFPDDAVRIDPEPVFAGIGKKSLSLLKGFQPVEHGTVVGDNLPVAKESPADFLSGRDVVVGAKPGPSGISGSEGYVDSVKVVSQRKVKRHFRFVADPPADPFVIKRRCRSAVDLQDMKVPGFGNLMKLPDRLNTRGKIGKAFQGFPTQSGKDHFLSGPSGFVKHKTDIPDHVIPVDDPSDHLYSGYLQVADFHKPFQVQVSLRGKGKQQFRIVPAYQVRGPGAQPFRGNHAAVAIRFQWNSCCPDVSLVHLGDGDQALVVNQLPFVEDRGGACPKDLRVRNHPFDGRGKLNRFLRDMDRRMDPDQDIPVPSLADHQLGQCILEPFPRNKLDVPCKHARFSLSGAALLPIC